MPRYLIITVVIFVNALLLFVLNEANHLLAPLGVSLHGQALAVLFAGLYLRVLHGAILSLLIGLLSSAAGPGDTGSLTLLFLLLWSGAVFMRRRIRREVKFQVRMTALLLQTCAFLYLMLVFSGPWLTLPAFWLRVLADSALSFIFVTAASVAWVEFQIRLLESSGWDIRSERPEDP
ncbi:MAG: hypothetical protein JJT96_18660 [Opitutales bacterium]|nr:hypothetical protein [Opitutales bacterium]